MMRSTAGAEEWFRAGEADNRVSGSAPPAVSPVGTVPESGRGISRP